MTVNTGGALYVKTLALHLNAAEWCICTLKKTCALARELFAVQLIGSILSKSELLSNVQSGTLKTASAFPAEKLKMKKLYMLICCLLVLLNLGTVVLADKIHRHDLIRSVKPLVA